MTEVKTCIQASKKHCLKKALIELGFKEHMVEMFEEKQALRGYSGDTRAQKANVRIKGNGWSGQNYVGGASNDLGFEFHPDGTCTFHVSDYDKHKYNQKWQDNLMKIYSKEVILEQIDLNQFFIKEQTVDANGCITIKAGTIF